MVIMSCKRRSASGILLREVNAGEHVGGVERVFAVRAENAAGTLKEVGEHGLGFRVLGFDHINAGQRAGGVQGLRIVGATRTE
jgi:hypothetical protein